MGTLLSYSGLSTKIRAMESQLINTEQLQEIVEMTNESQIVSFLKKQPGYARLWADLDENAVKCGIIEQHLQQTIYQNFTKIYRFANAGQKRFLDMYFRRYEMSVLKDCLRNLLDHREITLDLSRFEPFFNRHSKLKLPKLTECTAIPQFVEALSDSVFYPLLHQMANSGEDLLVFDYGMALDQFYFAQIWKMKNKFFTGRDLKEITMAYGQKFDLINLTWIYRARKYYHMNEDTVFTMLIPMHYHLSLEEIQALVQAKTEEEFESLLRKTYYGRRYEEVTAKDLEPAYTELMRSLLKREASRHPHSVIIMYSYLYQKEHEVRRLTTAVQCVRYGVPAQEAMRHVLRS